MNDLVTGFLDYCRLNEDLSPNTLEGYGWDLKQFCDWLSFHKLNPESIKVRDVDDFFAFVRKRGVSIGTVNRKMYALRSFYRYLRRREVIRENPMELSRHKKEPQKLPKFLNLDQQKILLEEAAKQNGEAEWIHARNYLIFLLLLDTGLRVAEVCSIRLRDIDFSSGTFRVMGKGRKERIIVLSDRLKRAIQEYLVKLQLELTPTGVSKFPGFAARGITLDDVGLNLRIEGKTVRHAIQGWCNYTFENIREWWLEEGIKLPQEYLFFSRNAKPLITRHVYRILYLLGKKVGIDLHPHLLRHTFATNLRRKKADLLLIKEALGHSSVSTTQIYANIGNDEYYETMRKLLQ